MQKTGFFAIFRSKICSFLLKPGKGREGVRWVHLKIYGQDRIAEREDLPQRICTRSRFIPEQISPSDLFRIAFFERILLWVACPELLIFFMEHPEERGR
jgi:hypothetical protein